MVKTSMMQCAFALAALSACACPPVHGQVAPAGGSSTKMVAAGVANPAPQSQSDLIIENTSDLPDAFPHMEYEVRFHAHGGVTPFHWRLEKGALPSGLKLEDDGRLHGPPERSGDFQFTVSVTDSGKPQQAVQKEFGLRVRSGLSLDWGKPAHVNGSRIEGSVLVSNVSPDDMDLTFVVMAVAGNGRATAIGYQHFVLPRGTHAMELPFGENLPFGGYIVHVDVVGEVEAKNVIYREKMDTPHQLHVTVGP
jgi:hypothetical protein